MFSGSRAAAVAAAMALGALTACAARVEVSPGAARPAVHGTADIETLARRFAPTLRLHAEEPFPVADAAVVFHPDRPLIGYHVFFADDVLRPHEGDRLDHEVIWVAYDPVTLKITDVFTYWHRTVLRTNACVAQAQRESQRPTVDVQWGQHGILPLGWEALKTARPRAELRLHYQTVTPRDVSVFPAYTSAITFGGSYEDYVHFTVSVDLNDFIAEGDVMVSVDPQKVLAGRIESGFAAKKKWPYQ